MNARFGRIVLTIVAAAAVAVPGCSDGAAAPKVTKATPSATTFVGKLDISPASGPAGTKVRVLGRGLPASANLKVNWGTVDCSWSLKGEFNEEYHGRECQPRSLPLAPVTTDASGSLDTSIAVPDDYGFSHEVQLLDANGKLLNRSLFEIPLQLSIEPKSGPVGTPIRVEVRGLGWQTLEDNRSLLYDNGYVGFISALSTRGTAHITIPATGEIGVHHIHIGGVFLTSTTSTLNLSSRPKSRRFPSSTKASPSRPGRRCCRRQRPPRCRPRNARRHGRRQPAPSSISTTHRARSARR